MDTTFYEIGDESECVTCLAEAQDSAEKKRIAVEQFEESFTTFLVSPEVGAERKQAAIDIFLST